MTRPTPRGFTLVELLVALTLLGVVLGAVVALAAAQQRAHGALAARASARAQVRDAALLLARDLRASAGDVREASDTALELVATTGGSVACAVPGGATMELPPAEPPETALTWWVAAPRPGDLALVLDSGADPGEGDDRWLELPVAAVGASAAACAGSPFAGDAPGGYRVSLAAPLPATVVRGAPVAFARRRRWTHYRASDGSWYLGLREWDGASWSETQPAAGPLRRAGGSAAGMSVLVLDSAGAPLASGLDGAAGARVVLRADPAVAWGAGRYPVVPESVRTIVGVRGVRRWVP